MDIFGIGMPELLFILVIVLIVLGPNEMQKTAQVLGDSLRKLVMSNTWKVITKTSHELQTLPHKLIREANLRDIQQELKNTSKTVAGYGSWERASLTEAPAVTIASPEPPDIAQPKSAEADKEVAQGGEENA
ncbi:MAG: twin-arginine translocase TatA/TatE family subunit [Candidatus Villigracilaceae bacterium]